MSYQSKLLFAFVSYSLFIILIITIFMVMFVEKKHTSRRMLQAEEVHKYKVDGFIERISRVDGALVALKASTSLKEYLSHPNEADLRGVKELFFSITYENSHIMQLRYIDENGIERIRINRADSDSYPNVVSEDALQNKSHRYYFKEVMQIDENKIWYSKIDLNVEHEQIERPIKPVLRVALRVFNDSIPKGIIIVNVFIQGYLDTLVSSKENDIYLIDKEGNILVSSDHQHDWRQYIAENESGLDSSHVNNLNLQQSYYVKELGLDNGQELKLIVKPQYVTLLEIVKAELDGVIIVLLLVYLMSFPLAYVFSRYPARLEKEVEEHNIYLQMRIDKAIEQFAENQRILLHQHRLAQMGEMLSMIAHQWRQPLSTITGIIAAIKTMIFFEKDCDAESLGNELSKIELQTQNLSAVISDFQHFYDPERPKENVSMNALIESALSIFASQLKSNKTTLHTDLKADKPINVYANHLKQAILTILQNALEAYASYESNEKILEIKTFINERSHVIEIGDHAGGIPDEIIDDIFMPYFSTKKDKHGTGIGLYMTKTIVEQQCGGSLSVRNESNGAVFTILLPEND